MTTFVGLRTAVSRDLSDPDAKTFTPTVVGDLVNAALAEVGRIAPMQYQEDVTPIADTLTYQLLSSDPGNARDIELARVELWDITSSPSRYLARLRPGASEYVNISAVGWRVWGGVLELSNDQEDLIDPAAHLIRVWGYAPYPQLVDDADVVPTSTELEFAVRAYARVEALNRLVMSRDLFTQWQTRSGNTNVTPAGLMNSLAQAQEDWRRRSRQLLRLRESP